jgi:hypothetical protein
MRVSEHIIDHIRILYANQQAAVRTEYGDTEWFEVRKYVRQGCILPHIYSICTIYIVKDGIRRQHRFGDTYTAAQNHLLFSLPLFVTALLPLVSDQRT